MNHLIGVAAVLAMALTAMGAPVSAAGTGKVAIVNGFPGKSIDICINSREYRSGLRYGQTLFRTLPGGLKNLKIYKKDRRTCRGQLLANTSFGLPGGSDRTIVVTRFGPRIQSFDNKAYGINPTPGPWSIWFWRNASDIGGVTLDLASDAPNPNPVEPAFDPDPVWAKGAQADAGWPNPSLLVLTTVFTIADTTIELHEPDARVVRALYRYEWILIGTDPSNSRLVFIKRPIPPIS